MNPTEVFSSECFKIFKNSYFIKHLWLLLSFRFGEILLIQTTFLHKSSSRFIDSLLYEKIHWNMLKTHRSENKHFVLLPGPSVFIRKSMDIIKVARGNFITQIVSIIRRLLLFSNSQVCYVFAEVSQGSTRTSLFGYNNIRLLTVSPLYR